MIKQSQFEVNNESVRAEDNLNPTMLEEEGRGISILEFGVIPYVQLYL
jgi:hypothetical protein